MNKLFVLLAAMNVSALCLAQVDTVKSDTSRTGWSTIIHNPQKWTSFEITSSDPCESIYWPLIFSETCSSNPMHCRHCGKELKKGESFAYIVMEVKNKTKYADWIHVRCALKRIKP